ncbi:MAG: VanW family protein [Clostridiales bacterium]|nr:VanW family protein [Clostridiales bacterium]
MVYKNTKVAPVMYVKYNMGDSGVQTLVEGVDYKVKYSNNNTTGFATAKITGLTNFTGTIIKNFYIIPAKVTGVSVSSPTSSSLTIKWTKLNKVTGYEILVYNSSEKTYSHLAYVSSKYSSYKVSGISTGTVSCYKIRAYKTIDSKKYYGSYSKSASNCTKPAQVKVTSVSMSGSSLTVKWKSITGSGYQIFYSTDKKMKKNVKSVYVSSSSKVSYTIKNFSSSKTYYIKVRAYKNYNSKKRYGEKSALTSNNYTNVYVTYSSNYVSNANRTNNLSIASKAISGTIIAPGETFSFNEVVGARTSAKGYKAALVFTGSTGVSDQLGGGICQVASTMFNCALKANVTITERHQHSQRVSYVPLGRDAAISGSAKKFQIYQ